MEKRRRPPSTKNGAVKTYRKRPWKWLYDGFGVELWEKQEEIFKSVWNNRYTCVKSCFASGKSYMSGMLALTFVHLYLNSIVVTTAPSFRQLDNIWGPIHKVHETARADPGSRLLKHEIRCGPQHYAVGFTTNMPERLQGKHAAHVLIIEDESAGIDAAIHQRLLDALMTGSDCHFLAIGNPLSPEGHFYEMFSDSKYEKFTISAFDTPNIKEGEEVIPGLVTQEWIDEKRAEVGEDSPIWKSQVLGEFPPTSEDVLIPLSWVRKAQDRWENAEPAQTSVYGLDPSAGGLNETALCPRAGSYVYPIKTWQGLDSPQIISHVKENILSNSLVYVDTIGVGWGIHGELRNQDVNAVETNVKRRPEEEERFKNLRAELYWAIREALDPSGRDPLALPPDDKLAGQLTSIRYKIDSKGRIQIESKDDMRKRGMQSPDRADALMLTMKGEHAGIRPIEVNVKSTDFLTRDNPFGYISWADYKY